MAGGYVLEQITGAGFEELIQVGGAQGRNAQEAARFERTLRGVARVAGTIGAARAGGKMLAGHGGARPKTTGAQWSEISRAIQYGEQQGVKVHMEGR